jgi:hypothetical protein
VGCFVDIDNTGKAFLEDYRKIGMPGGVNLVLNVPIWEY